MYRDVTEGGSAVQHSVPVVTKLLEPGRDVHFAKIHHSGCFMSPLFIQGIESTFALLWGSSTKEFGGLLGVMQCKVLVSMCMK